MGRYNQHTDQGGGSYLIPPGIYDVKIIECKKQESKDGLHEQWLVKFAVKNSKATIQDWITFKDSCMNRIGWFLKCFGLLDDTNLDREYQADEAVGKTGLIRVITQTGTDGRERNKIPYDGYHTYENHPGKPNNASDDIPF